MIETATAYKQIRFVPFKDLLLWDVKRMLRKSITSDFPIVKLGTVITEQNNREKIFEKPNEDFKILGVNNKVGLFDAYIEKGKNINQPYKKVEEGWLAFNPYRINVGSIGIKLPQHKYDYISPAYVVFSCKNELHPEFLFLLFKTDTFNAIIRENTTGSVRQNLLFDTLSNLQIPLPSIIKQKELVDVYHKQVALAESQETEAEKLFESISDFLYETLEINVPKQKMKKDRLSFVRFKDISRWDTLYLFGNTFSFGSSFPLFALGKCVRNFLKDLNGNSLRFETFKHPDKEFYYLGMESVEKNTGELVELPSIKGSEIKSQTLRIPFGYFIYGKLRPYLNKFWLNNIEGREIVCSSEFFAFDIDLTVLDKDYFNLIIGSQIIQKQISDKFSGVRMPRISKTDFLQLIIPVPDISVQRSIVETATLFKKNIQLLKQKEEENRANAVQIFEASIFKG